MAISDTITSMYENVGNVYDVLELAGADLTNVDKNIENLKQSWEERLLYFLANGTDVVWNNWLPKVTGSGETITLNNTIEAKMDFVYKGNTYQYSTSGKNLFDNVYGQTRNVYKKNIKASNPLGSLDCYPINLLPNTKYTLKIDMNGYRKTSTWIAGVCFENGDVISLLQSNSMENITTTTFTTDSTGVVYVGQRYGFTYGETGRMDLFLQTAKIQLEKGTTATDYEPYTNGASPNPDYPQDIQVVTGNNTIKVEGKNLFDKDNPNIIHKQPLQNGNIDTSSNYVATYLPAKEGDVFTISTTSNLFDNYAKIWFISENPATATTWLSKINRNSGETSITATAPQNTKYVCFYMIYSNNQTTINSLFETIQVEKSNEATTYEAYQGQDYTVNLGNIELCKIGDYQDKIAKSSGKNLFDKTSSTVNKYLNSSDGSLINSSTSSTSDYIDIKSSTTYIISGYGTSNYYKVVAYYNSSKTFISANTVTDAINTYSITTPNNAKYLRFHYTTANESQIMLNEGTTALPYEPYGKVWYLNKQIGKVVLDGSENWQENGATKGLFQVTKSNVISILNEVLVKSTHFRAVTGQYLSDNASTEDLITSNFTNNRLMFIYKQYANNLTDFKTWLSTHNTTVYYVLATPTTTEITDTTLISQLEAIKKSYNTQTSISQVNNDLPFELDVVALGELD